MAAAKLSIAGLLKEVRRCTLCAPHLAHGPRPIVQLGVSARVLVIGQAPGSKVHESGVPWRDQSGDRLREWTGLDERVFYDANRVALMPMGFCYPGTAKGADLPPRPECAPLWHDRLLAALPELRLMLLVGGYAQDRYLGAAAAGTMTETVRAFAEYGKARFPLPHPSWRSTGWMRSNPWFESMVLPALRARVRTALGG
jgi:uracil-DNA glycosylase